MSRGERQTYAEHAAEAGRLARRAASDEERQAYERIAAVWRDLAESDQTPEAAAEQVTTD